MEQEIQKLRQRISEGEENNRTHSISSEEKTSSPVSHIQSLNTLLPLSDDRYAVCSALSVPETRSCRRSRWFVILVIILRINAYIEEEVQRRLRKMNLLNGSSSNMDLSLSCESLKVRTDPHASPAEFIKVLLHFIHVRPSHGVLVHVVTRIFREQSLKTTRRAFRNNLRPY